MFKGRRYRVSCSALGIARDAWTWEGSYQAANNWWQQARRRLDTPPASPLDREMDEKIRWAAENQPEDVADLERLKRLEMSDDEETAAFTIDLLRQNGATIELPDDIDPFLVREIFGNERIWLDRRARSAAPPGASTTSEAIDDFLGILATKQKPLSYREVKEFLDTLRSEMSVTKMDEAMVAKVYRKLANADLASGTKKKRWGFFKRFVNYLYESGHIELPRNVNSRLFAFRFKANNIRTYPLETIQSELKALPEQLRLYAYLGLNCGMTNADIGCLRQDAVQRGYLTRKRVKTGDNTNVPVVCYRLWPETMTLLEKFRSSDPELWLVSKGGTCLWETRIEEGKPKVKDLVHLAWKRYGKCKIKLKDFRSVASTLLDDHKEYGRYGSYFLGHSPKSLKDKHYTVPSQVVFDKALLWLRKRILG